MLTYYIKINNAVVFSTVYNDDNRKLSVYNILINNAVVFSMISVELMMYYQSSESLGPSRTSSPSIWGDADRLSDGDGSRWGDTSLALRPMTGVSGRT